MAKRKRRKKAPDPREEPSALAKTRLGLGQDGLRLVGKMPMLRR